MNSSYEKDVTYLILGGFGDGLSSVTSNIAVTGGTVKQIRPNIISFYIAFRETNWSQCSQKTRFPDMEADIRVKP